MTGRHKVFYLYLSGPALQLMVRVYMMRYRKTATDLETDMQTFLECKISSKVDIIDTKTM